MEMLTTRALALMAGNGAMVLKFIETLLDPPDVIPSANIMRMFGMSPIIGLIAAYVMLIAIQRTPISKAAATIRRGAEFVSVAAIGYPLLLLLFATTFGFGDGPDLAPSGQTW